MCGVEISDLPCLASRHNLNLTSEDMADIQRQGISVEEYDDPSPKNIPLQQLEEDNSYRLGGIICSRRLKNLHNTYAAFKNYSREVVMKMTELELF